MKEKIIKNKKTYIILSIIITLLVIGIPSTIAFYYSGIDSPLETKFKIEYNSIFARAYVVTYWEDAESNEIIAKKSWKLKETVVNSNWTKIDDYYYYNGTISKENIENEIPTTGGLINEGLSLTELSDEDLANPKYNAKYKIIYEYIEAEENENGISSEDAWGITFASNGTPSKK